MNNPRADSPVRYHVTVDDATFEVEFDAEGVRVDGDRMETCGPELVSRNFYFLLVGGVSHKVLAERGGSGLWDLQLRGVRYRAEVVDDRTRVMRDVTSAGLVAKRLAPIRAPMPGLVVKVVVEEGEWVEAGGGLLVVEAMKMENLLTAATGGRVGAVHVVAGQTVEKDEILMDILPPDKESEREGD